MEVRLIETDYPDDPFRNLAMDEAIFREVERGRSPTTFRFYRNRNAVILGCFQSAEEELDMEYARSKDIKIAKRFTGGGAVYHDMGDLNYSVISKDNYNIGMNVRLLFDLMMKGASNALELAGVPSIKAGMNDITSNGKKIMGSAATMKKGVVLFHAALLVNTNLTTLASVLKVPGIKLKDKGISTILERVSNIQDISGKDIDDVKEALLYGYSNTLGFEYTKGGLTENEDRLLRRLHRDKYTKDEWNLGREFIHIKG